MDPFELVYFIRTGVQQLLTDADIVIDSIGLAYLMPGYLMVWDRSHARHLCRVISK